eukprot:1326718-Amorphochlora_amoeboformis.AAC.2
MGSGPEEGKGRRNPCTKTGHVESYSDTWITRVTFFGPFVQNYPKDLVDRKPVARQTTRGATHHTHGPAAVSTSPFLL